MPDETPPQSKVIDLSAAREQAKEKDGEQPTTQEKDADGPFCPFSWMLGHGQNKLTNQVVPVPFANVCLKERCAVYNAKHQQCGILTIAQRVPEPVEAPSV